MPGLIDLHFAVYAESAESFLEKMAVVMSDESIVTFLEGPANAWFTERASARFANEGDDASGGWKDLADATQDIREALGYGRDHPINERTGALHNWATSPGTVRFEEGSVGAVWPGDDPSGELADKVIHAQEGGNSTWGNAFPARPVVAFNENDVAGIAVAFATWFVEATSL